MTIVAKLLFNEITSLLLISLASHPINVSEWVDLHRLMPYYLYPDDIFL